MRTNGEKITEPSRRLRILIAPLDWGLGHTTRCIPIIYALLNAGASVWLAGEKNTETILKKEFPQLPFILLRGYNVQYSKNKIFFFTKLLSQVPAIKRIILYEHKWLQKVVKDYEIDGVISDNRFGLYHATTPVIFITHQLHIETGNKWLNILTQKINYSYINRFSQCWVPDVESGSNLAGKLSHPNKRPSIPVKYLGIVSRFKKQEQKIVNDLLVVLSGPEPQRSIFESIILEQLKTYQGKVVLVRGLPSQASNESIAKKLEVYNYLNAAELNIMMQQSAIVLSRSGYTTIMDLTVLQQKAILVPTPGQAEQEYIASHLKQQGIFYTCIQKHFDLNNALIEAERFYKTNPAAPAPFNESVIISWLAEIQNTKVLK